MIDHGIFHGIKMCSNRETRVVTGFWRAIDNRVGVTEIFNTLIYNN